jgi:hypothetical protein
MFRGTLAPHATAEVRAKLWVGRPGAVALGGWTAESEVGEEGAADGNAWRAAFRYRQRAPPDDPGFALVVTNAAGR